MGVAGIGAVASTGGSATAGDVSCTDLPQDMQNFAPSVNCAPQYMQYLIMHSISAEIRYHHYSTHRLRSSHK